MKKVFLAALLISACVCSFAKEKKFIYESGEAYLERVRKEAFRVEPVEYREIVNGNDVLFAENKIKYSDLDEDLDMLCYLLETAYAGYEDACEKGLDLDDFKREVKARFLGRELIKIGDYKQELVDDLAGKIRDCHFTFFTEKNSNWLCGNTDVCFSNIYAKKDGEIYKIIESDVEEISVGQEYTGSEKNLFYYPAKGDDFYRLGVVGYGSKSIFVNVDDSDVSIEVPVKSEPLLKPLNVLKVGSKETEDTGYISASECISDKKIEPAGQKFRNKKNIIIDLRGNTGGYSGTFKDFFKELYLTAEQSENPAYEKAFQEKYDQLGRKSMTVMSPASFQSELNRLYLDKKNKNFLKHFKQIVEASEQNPEKYFIHSGDSMGHKAINGDFSETESVEFPEIPCFKGKIYILMDGNSASASEQTVAYARHFFGDNVYVVGKNSMGCCEYGGTIPYYLPKSKIGVCICESKTVFIDDEKNWHGEGFGYYPDYWSNDSDLLETLVKLTEDEALREKLQYIEMALQ